MYRGPDGEATKDWEKVHDTKLDAIESIVEELQGAPLLVAYQFKHELERIQAYWAAYRRYQKNLLEKSNLCLSRAQKKVFLCFQDGQLSVVKGSRIAPQDGYVVAVNGLALTLSSACHIHSW